MNKLRVLIADDERPARELLKSLLIEFESVEVIGEAENGADAVEMIKRIKPELAILDLKMPEMTGLEAVRMLRKTQMPLIAFATAHDEFAVEAFELNAVDYLLKPVERARLADTINRAVERLEKEDWRTKEAEKVRSAAAAYDDRSKATSLDRLPVKFRDEILLVPVNEIISIVADGELLHISTARGAKYTINHRLKDLETRLDPSKFFRLSRGSIINLDHVKRISPMPGGTYFVALSNGSELASSRIQSKVLRSRLLKL